MPEKIKIKNQHRIQKHRFNRGVFFLEGNLIKGQEDEAPFLIKTQ